MMRRMLLLTALPLSANGKKVPVNMDRLNALATQYNAYIELLQRDVVDVAQWERAERAWERLE